MKVFRVDVICQDYDPYYYSSTHIILGDNEKEVYSHYRWFYEEGFEEYNREIEVEEINQISHFLNGSYKYNISVLK